VQLRPFVKVVRDAFGDRRMTLLPQGGKPDKEYPFYVSVLRLAAGDDKEWIKYIAAAAA
jgi:hypothetical protein